MIFKVLHCDNCEYEEQTQIDSNNPVWRCPQCQVETIL